MSNAPTPDIAEEFLTLLRTSAEVMPAPQKERLAARLAGAAPLPLASPAQKAAIHAPATSFWRSPRAAALLALPFGALLGVLAYRASSVKTSNLPTPVVIVKTMNPVPSLPSAAPPEKRAPTSEPSAQASTSRVPLRSASPKPSTLPADSAARTTASSAPLPDSDADLSLLEQARSIFAEGNAAHTLELLNVHERRFPASPFRQEREALTIKSLVAVGQREAATTRADAFVKRYPASPLRASVERAVGKKL